MSDLASTRMHPAEAKGLVLRVAAGGGFQLELWDTECSKAWLAIRHVEGMDSVLGSCGSSLAEPR